MPCPDCGKKMLEDVVDNQQIQHCENCGGTFFEENGINRISFSTSQRLAEDKNLNELTILSEKRCPKDRTTLTPSRSEETIPPDVILFQCHKCQGVFVSANDLVVFKKAINAKLDYFKIWGIPLPSVRSIAVLSFVLFVAVSSFAAFTLWQQQNISNIQAQDLVRNLYITSSSRYLLISFKTAIPVKSKIIFIDKTTGETIEKQIKGEPADYHILTTGDLNLQDEIYYQIVLIDDMGNETKTDVNRLKL